MRFYYYKDNRADYQKVREISYKRLFFLNVDFHNILSPIYPFPAIISQQRAVSKRPF